MPEPDRKKERQALQTVPAAALQTIRQTLLEGAPALHCSITEAQADAFCRYSRLLLEKNQVMNLTAITEPAAVARLHFLDCLTLLQLADFSGKRVIDVGCGAGFPGIPLVLAEPSIRLTLLDSLAKRTAWLQEILPQLPAEAEVLTGRAEELVSSRREQYDLVVSRAVAGLPVLCELCLPWVRPGGMFLAMKGEQADTEAAQAASAIRKLGGRLERVAGCGIPGTDVVHRVVIIRKERPTPVQYPRRYAKIKQDPL